MKKTVKKMSLSRETLRGLTGGIKTSSPVEVSVPSCIDGCPSNLCTTTEGQGFTTTG